MGIIKMALIIAAMFGTIALTNRLLGEKRTSGFTCAGREQGYGYDQAQPEF